LGGLRGGVGGGVFKSFPQQQTRRAALAAEVK
jgi:hypothetical protein